MSENANAMLSAHSLVNFADYAAECAPPIPKTYDANKMVKQKRQRSPSIMDVENIHISEDGRKRWRRSPEILDIQIDNLCISEGNRIDFQPPIDDGYEADCEME